MGSLQDLIPVVNKLQDIVTNTNLTDLDLPLLTVVGSQSSGKSSVLENIVGKDFLPRGTGIVTRRPLILQLINISEDDPLIDMESYEDAKSTPSTSEMSLEDHLKNLSTTSSASKSEWGEFLHLPGKRFYSFDDIRDEIEKETARIAGKNKGISRVPINLKIYSPKVLNLTMVDLPGLTKIPIGDQPSDIERQIKNLILEYVSKPNSIILAVSPANVDLVNSESLKLARQVDPQGKRTVGILSKLDLMDHGTNALDILTGKVYPLKLGFIGVVNRSQQDIAQKKSLEDSLRDEQEFFNNHPAYKAISNKCGTSYLAKTLNKTLMHHIRERLPDIKAKLNSLIGQTEQELASYGSMSIVSQNNRGTLILKLMNKFANNFINAIEGNSLDISTKELCGGARIYFIYNEVFGQSLTSINPTANLSAHDIRTVIRNSTGPRPSLFVPELAFDLLVKPQIKLLESPSHRCVELVYEELMKIGHSCGNQELSRFPKLQTRLVEVVSELLRERLGPTTQYVESLIEIHRAYINTNHPNFVGAADAMASVVAGRQKLKKSQAMKTSESHNQTNNHFELNGFAKEILADSSLSQSTSNKNSDAGSSTEAESKPMEKSNTHTHTDSKDTFLNFFFGKEQPQQQNSKPEHARVPSPEPFHYPVQTDTLQFNNPATSPMSQHLDSLSLNTTDGEMSEREEVECELIRRLIISYFGIVREMIQDQVPKAIMCLLVNYCKESIQNCLVERLYKESMFDELLYEDENMAQEREKCEKLLATYREAATVISEVV